MRTNMGNCCEDTFRLRLLVWTSIRVMDNFVGENAVNLKRYFLIDFYLNLTWNLNTHFLNSRNSIEHLYKMGSWQNSIFPVLFLLSKQMVKSIMLTSFLNKIFVAPTSMKLLFHFSLAEWTDRCWIFIEVTMSSSRYFKTILLQITEMLTRIFWIRAAPSDGLFFASSSSSVDFLFTGLDLGCCPVPSWLRFTTNSTNDK